VPWLTLADLHHDRWNALDDWHRALVADPETDEIGSNDQAKRSVISARPFDNKGSGL
jgi:hypothetical protein